MILTLPESSHVLEVSTADNQITASFHGEATTAAGRHSFMVYSAVVS